MDVSEKWGNDIDTAVDLALAELKATRDEVEITVLEQPSRGFFGIGAKLALVRVERKKPEPEEKPEPESRLSIRLLPRKRFPTNRRKRKKRADLSRENRTNLRNPGKNQRKRQRRKKSR